MLASITTFIEKKLGLIVNAEKSRISRPSNTKFLGFGFYYDSNKGLKKQSNRGPKKELSIDQIVDAAVAIADKEGLSSVSMNRVASSLGLTPMYFTDIFLAKMIYLS
ncbi:hypothetical protein [Oceanobacillus alkalisoli]|uniref:hypothetical protein n=1 Tax=Oceanobacillus alkalisoli TaxID=2925113 RepID=UPI003F68A5BE